METSVFNVLVLIGFGLMVVISGGVGYLTLAEWRDRRRRDRDSRGDGSIPSLTKAASPRQTAKGLKAKGNKAKSNAKK